MLAADIRRCVPGGRLTLAPLLRAVARNWGLQALLAYRFGRALARAGRRWYWWPLLPLGWPLYYLLSRYVRCAYDIRLELSADIGAGLYIGHFGNIIVRNCRLGTYCSIAQSVHIEPALADGSGGPVIGAHVWIGAHARIRGPFEVGSGSTLSAGTVVVRDVPARSLCLGNPGRIVMRGYDNERLLNAAE